MCGSAPHGALAQANLRERALVGNSASARKEGPDVGSTRHVASRFFPSLSFQPTPQSRRHAQSAFGWRLSACSEILPKCSAMSPRRGRNIQGSFRRPRLQANLRERALAGNSASARKGRNAHLAGNSPLDVAPVASQRPPACAAFRGRHLALVKLGQEHVERPLVSEQGRA